MATVTKPLLTDETGQDIAESLNTLATGATSTTIAPAFSASSTYALNDRVIYNKTLYKCTTAVTSAGAWNPSNWTAETVGQTLKISAPVIITANSSSAPSDHTALWVYPA